MEKKVKSLEERVQGLEKWQKKEVREAKQVEEPESLWSVLWDIGLRIVLVVVLVCMAIGIFRLQCQVKELEHRLAGVDYAGQDMQWELDRVEDRLNQHLDEEWFASLTEDEKADCLVTELSRLKWLVERGRWSWGNPLLWFNEITYYDPITEERYWKDIPEGFQIIWSKGKGYSPKLGVTYFYRWGYGGEETFKTLDE